MEPPEVTLLVLLATQAFALEDPEVRVETLDNGLTVVVHEDRRTDTVALNLAYGVGSHDERPGEFGCAHLFEHLMFEGSKNVPRDKYDGWLSAAGGSNNAWTSDDETVYHATFPSGALDLALFLESDRLGFLDAGLDQENLDNQIGVVLQERAEGYAEPNGRDYDAVQVLLYPSDHPYGHSPIGTVADVEGFTLEGVVSFWRRHYRPDNAVLTLVGAVDPDHAIARVRHWFGDVPAREAESPRSTEPTSPALTDVHGRLEDDVGDRTLWMLWPGVTREHPDEPTLDVLTYLLEGGRGTRLDDALYFDRPLTSATSVFAPMSIGTGQIVVQVRSEKTPLRKLHKKVLRELRALEKRPPTEAELKRAKRAIRNQTERRLEAPEDVASALSDCVVYAGKPDCTEERWARVQAVTADDIVRVTRTYLLDVIPSTLSVVPRGDDGAMPGAEPVELP